MQHLSISAKSFLLIIVCAGLLWSCEQSKKEEQDHPPANGKIFTALGMDDAFIIATGPEDEILVKLLESYNEMNPDSIWAYTADTLSFHDRDGTVSSMTKADMADYFASVDSVEWMVSAIIPIKVAGGKRVSVITDGTSTIYHKDGSVERFKLLERFIFENQKVVAIHQWEAGIAENEANGM